MGAPLEIRQEAWVYSAKFGSSHSDTLMIPVDHLGYGVSLGDLNWNGLDITDGQGVFLGEGRLLIKGTGAALIVVQKKG